MKIERTPTSLDTEVKVILTTKELLAIYAALNTSPEITRMLLNQALRIPSRMALEILNQTHYDLHNKLKDYLLRETPGFVNPINNLVKEVIVRPAETEEEPEQTTMNFDKPIRQARPKPTPISGTRWAEDEIQLLRLLFSKGTKPKEIAKMLNRSESAVCNKLYELKHQKKL